IVQGNSSGRQRRKLMQLLAQFLPRTLQCFWIVIPVGPTRGDGHKNRVSEFVVPELLQNLRVFVVLNAVANGFKPDSRCGFARCDRSRRREGNNPSRSPQPAPPHSRRQAVPAGRVVSYPPPRCPSTNNSLPRLWSSS